MSNIELHVKTGCNELLELFSGTSIRTLSLGTAAASHETQILKTLCKLETLDLRGCYMDRCDFLLPVSLQKLTFQEGYCSREWLCSLTIALCSIGNPIVFRLYDLELQSSRIVDTFSSQKQASGQISDLKSYDMSKITLHVKVGSSELFEMFRDTSIPVLSLGTAAAATNASEIRPTLCKLEKLYLWGSYMGRFDLQLPISLKTLTFGDGCCSTEWLCSLTISLSSKGNPIWCKLYDFELLSSGTVDTYSLQIQPSDQISNLMSCDMSNIMLHVKAGSSELFEMFRDSSIHTLSLGTAAAATNASDILQTLCKLKILRLRGSYIGRFDLQLPVSLQRIVFEAYCSREWLCSLMITLSSILIGIVDTHSSQIQPSEQISNLLSCDMSNISLRVKVGSSELFEMFHDTNIRTLSLGTAAAASHASEILPTLRKLDNLLFYNGFSMDRFDFTLSPYVQLFSLQESTCSSELLRSLVIKLSNLKRSVRFYLRECVVLANEKSNQCYSDSSVYQCGYLSQVKFEIMKDSLGLYKTLPALSITSLNITKIEHADRLSRTLPLLTHLEQLRICLNDNIEINLPGSINYVYMIFKSISSSYLRQVVQNLLSLGRRIKCTFLFRFDAEEVNCEDIKQEFDGFHTIEVQTFDVVEKRFAAENECDVSLSATADYTDDDDDRHLLRRGGYVDSNPWQRYCKIRLSVNTKQK
ncbi:hypothetical protein DPMN_139718 [Dreissena polymorpha]|uniref:Uncharacterized protein n=1 Tax=Dreissena polymorpha TaxID=45954 RepID=A0A9D4JJP9_DREPO|nr:hypothetical protein DPMN_139718 [Dreissena polymorpha]